ncbi:hypothetical protein [Chryseobacterium pennipullorum]|uniref:Uncharacterized protein n=1 Tax=Chryseobacterium pennipullorum TaxID=2258963 RepID=A0A3D9B5A8_9FLAO|nr:hypothetical protein [Chryseobacterium pennipullorum]REC48840.1 hypothetical protein DRF67_04595 [Chryseobacterium pennipullorum]
MKYFGFIKEHDDYSISKSIQELVSNNSTIDSNKDRVLDYLQKGIMVIPLMGFVENAKDPLFGTDNYDDESFVAYNAIYTDGVWLWPQYILEYIKKYPNIKLDPEFVKHAVNNKKNIHITEEESLKIEKNFFQEFWK